MLKRKDLNRENGKPEKRGVSAIPRVSPSPRLQIMSLPYFIIQCLALASTHEVDRDVLLFLEALIQLKKLPRIIHILCI
jgi:hypothetical protein